jgi:N-acetylneuraminic acid mutarotase
VTNVIVLLSAFVLAPVGNPAPAGSNLTWGQTAAMDWTHAQMQAVHIGTRIYLIGDRDTLHIYDASTSAWSKGTAPPENQFGPAVALGGKIYVLGGVSGKRVTSNCEAYDPSADKWTSCASLPSARGAAGAAVLNGKIHLVGGRAYQGATLVDTNDHLVYDPTANTWHKDAPMPTSRDGLALVAVPSTNTLYAIGGWNAQSMNPSNANEAYSAATKTWTKGAPLPTPRFGAGSALVNGAIYIMGGSTNKVMYAVVEAYNVAAGTWSTAGGLPAARPYESAVAVNGTIFATGGDTLCQASACYKTNRFWTLKP